MSLTRKQINHILGNIPQSLKGMAKTIERLSRLSCKHCRSEAYIRLQHIQEDLLRHGMDLDTVRKNWDEQIKSSDDE